MRVQKLCSQIQKMHLDALWIENPSDLFYLTGQWFSCAKLFVRPKEAFLFLDGRYFEKAKQEVSCCNVALLNEKLLAGYFDEVQKIGFDSAHLTVERLQLLQKSVPGKEWVPVRRPLKELRMCKDAEECFALQKAANLTMDGFHYLLGLLQEGISEEALVLEFEIFCRKRGASKLSFSPIIAFAEHSAYPHHHSDQTVLEKDQMVLFDLGAVVDDYCADMTRVVFFGKPDPALQRLEKIVKTAYESAFRFARPGVMLGELDLEARKVFKMEGVEHLFPHGLGHGVGIDVHEPPIVRADGEDCNLILRSGMVFTIEPGLYLPGLGGVRYENTIVLTEDGPKNFNAC